MRRSILSALILASAFQTALGQTEWSWDNYDQGIAISQYRGSGGAVTIPSSINGTPVVRLRNSGGGGYAIFTGVGHLVTSLTIPDSVTSIEENALRGLINLTSLTMPDRFIGQVAQIGIGGQAATDYLVNYLVNALSNNDAFVTAVANKILAKSDNYGLSVKSELETLATYSELTSAIEPLATKTQITTAINEGKASGIASVTASPNTWSLFTTSQIQNMAVGDLVLTKNVGGTFTLNYDIEQSTDLQTWTPYQALSLPLTGLPTDKAFVRIKMINSTSNPPLSTASGSNL